jgi:hypothetical protein
MTAETFFYFSVEIRSKFANCIIHLQKTASQTSQGQTTGLPDGLFSIKNPSLGKF